MKTIKVCIVGAGQFSQCFVPLFQAHPLVNEVSLCEIIPERLRSEAARLKVSRTFSSFHDVLQSDVDAVAIFTQRWMHAPMSLQSLNAGKNVYCAVPAATTLEELQQLIETVNRTGLTYMMGETSLYYGTRLFMKEKWDAGAFGRFVYGEGEYYHDMSHGFYEAYQFSGGEHWKRTASYPPMLYPIRYLVIDDGWAERPDGQPQQNGDWIVNRTVFPDGLRATADAIRERGLIPGLWFEFEVCNRGSQAWDKTTHQLDRDGHVLQVANRRFWDFRDPWVHDYLSERVICLLKENNLGYLKVDYNETTGLGCDGAESPGEGLRQHLAGVQKFFARIRMELPELVIESCSSGGHRLEPSFICASSMSSFSDAHETPNIPIIAANLLPLVPSRQCQIWAVLRKTDSSKRLNYSLTATFLGRMCLSGEIHELSTAQWARVYEAIDLYRQVAPVIGNGLAVRYGVLGSSYESPRGWQAVVRTSPDNARCLIVLHTFAGINLSELVVPLPPGNWQILRSLVEPPGKFEVVSNQLCYSCIEEFTGAVLILKT